MAVRRNIPKAGNTPLLSRPLVRSIEPSVVYVADGPNDLDRIYDEGVAGYTYAREAHPNADRLATILDDMEGSSGGSVLGSGMAAVTAVLLGLTQSGDHVLGGDQLYGRSLRLMNEDLPRLGIRTSVADPTNITQMRAAMRPETKLILVEVVSNPTLQIADIKALAQLAKETGALLVVDNTFTTPRAFRPFELGADIVIHSVTKLLSGHSDVTLGYLAARDPALNERLKVVSASFGLTPSPYECWLAERGLLTFHLRYDRAEANALALAQALEKTKGVKRVLYPGLKSHPQHQRAKDLLGDRFGNMLSFELENSRETAERLVRNAPKLAFAPTLGDVATTLSHPPSSSHRALSEAERANIGITEGFFRVSVGIEPIDELIAEFSAAISG